jgi:hypothetical protein
MKITELEKGTTHIGARVNSYFINLLKECQIPISDVVESMIGKFLTLSDSEKLDAVHHFRPINLEVSKIAHVKRVWSPADKAYGKVETLREVLTHTTDENLSRLAMFHSEFFKAHSEIKNRQDIVNELIACLRVKAEYAFGSKLEYDDMVKKLIEKMNIVTNAKELPSTDFLEMEIVRKTLIDKVQTISCEDNRELAKSLGLKNDISKNELQAVLAGEWSALLAYKLSRLIVDIICPLKEQEQLFEYGHAECVREFQSIRDCLVVITCLVALLRQEYRYGSQQKCNACGFVVSVGMKFCSECGNKLGMLE